MFDPVTFNLWGKDGSTTRRDLYVIFHNIYIQ